MVLGGLAIVVIFLSWFVLPAFDTIFSGFKVDLPAITTFVLVAGRFLPWVMLGILAIVLIVPVLGLCLRRNGMDRSLVDRLVLPLPLIGPILRKNLLAGWCNALKLGVESGLDLRAAIELADDSSTSPALRRESLSLIVELDAGRMPGSVSGGRILPPAATAAIAIGIQNHSLPETLSGLSQMYQQQAEMRLRTLPGILSPVLILISAALVAVVITALVAPLLTLIGNLGGGSRR